MRYHWPYVLSMLAAAPFGNLAMPLKTLWDDIYVKHTWNATPAKWENLGPPPTGTTIDLYIALKPDRENALIDVLYEVSNPSHPKYRAYLSKDQVAELVAPHQDTLDLVNSWLEHHGISSSSVSRTHGGGWLTVSKVPVSQADSLLGASYQLYRLRGTDGVVILRTVGYALPSALHAHVKAVAPTTHFGSPRILQQTPRKRSRGEATAMKNATSGELVTVSRRKDIDEVEPSFLRWLYKTFAYVPVATGQNVLGIVGYLDSFPSQEDLTSFMDEFRHDAGAATYTVVKVNGGGYDPSKPGSEANGNIQYAGGMAYPTPLVFYSTGGGVVRWPNGEPAPGDGYLEWLNYILNEKNIPQTISISYGTDELDMPREYATTLCNMFARLGTLGVSVLVASGNQGVGYGDCRDKSGEVRFNPAFPASCPFVTSVGGTTGYEPEVAASLSQGGFSLLFERPSYQDGAVTTFLEQLGDKHLGLYDPEGRGVPDLAAQALNYVIFNNSVGKIVDGTSCAAPTVAGIISLLNDYLLSQGRDPLGFLNPWLYGRGLAGLNDITSGSNPGCNTDGFSAIAGWDPVTGLGTPNFEKLQKIPAASPSALPTTSSIISAHSTGPTSPLLPSTTSGVS